MKKKIILTFSAVLVLLSACASSEEKKTPRLCPQVAILRSLERMEDYGNDTLDPANLVAVGVMQKVQGKCVYEDSGVDVTFDLHMAAEKGPRLGGDRVSFAFFVSLLGADDKVFGKELMTADFTFPAEAKTAVIAQPLRVFIPLSKDEDAGNHRVLVGFQLTEA